MPYLVFEDTIYILDLPTLKYIAKMVPWLVVWMCILIIGEAVPIQDDIPGQSSSHDKVLPVQDSACTNEPAFNQCEDISISNPDWMSNFPDDTSLKALSIPGTHDSMAHYGGVLAVCQQWRLGTQYEAGIRFLDIRLRHVGKNLNIHHGIAYQFANFYDMLNISRDFLADHPSETVLMRIKEEHTPSRPEGTFPERVQDHIDQYPGLVWTHGHLPLLGEARGKLIILQNFDGPVMGIPWGSLALADDWQVPDLGEEAIQKKWDSVETNLDLARSTFPDKDLYLTFSSGASALAWPNNVAKRINPRLLLYLKDNPSGRLGMIAMDFQGEDIVQRIVNSNFGTL